MRHRLKLAVVSVGLVIAGCSSTAPPTTATQVANQLGMSDFTDCSTDPPLTVGTIKDDGIGYVGFTRYAVIYFYNSLEKKTWTAEINGSPLFAVVYASALPVYQGDNWAVWKLADQGDYGCVVQGQQ